MSALPAPLEDRLVVGLAAGLSCAHAAWTASAATPAAAAAYVAALRAAQVWYGGEVAAIARGVSSGPLVAWEGLWLAGLPPGPAVLAASLLPFHLAAAAGSWRGGKALGGRIGGAWALAAGLAAPGMLAAAGQGLADFAVAAGVVFAAGAMLERRWDRAGIGLVASVGARAAAAPPIASLAIELLARGRRRAIAPLLAAALVWVAQVPALRGSFAVPPLAELAPGLAAHVGNAALLAQPLLLVAVVLGLLVRADNATLRPLGQATGVLLGLAVFLPPATTAALPVVPLLALVGASAARAPGGRVALAALGLLVGIQVVGGHTDRVGWPGTPAALRAPAGAPYDVDAVLDWLVAHAPADERPVPVALHLAETDRLHAGLFEARALERGLPLAFVVVDASHPLADPTSLGVVITSPGVPTPRQGWREQLPPPTTRWSWPDGLEVDLTDRGLPPETLLTGAGAGAARYHPRRQGLYVYVDGQERGPLITPASSAAVVRTDDGYDALFVRDQALWRATSADGLTFGEAVPMGIAGFDPAVARLDDGSFRLYAAVLAGGRDDVDPAAHPTTIASWRGPRLDALTREPGARLDGLGLVDPSVVRRPDGTWELYFTEGRTRVGRAVSADGLAFTRDAGFSLPAATVPLAIDDGGWLVTQRQIMGRSVLQAAVRTDAGAFGEATLLDLCGTGPSATAGRLYYSREEDDCPPPIVLPARRRELPWR